jgi:twitching motility protein PilT
MQHSQIAAWLEAVSQLGATDLHLIPGLPPMARRGGTLAPLGSVEALDETAVKAVVAQLLEGRDGLDAAGDLDFAFSFGDHSRFRGNIYRQNGSVAVALRAIPLAIPTPEELGLPPVVQQVLGAPSGLLIVTGPTGGGKSTTLAGLLDWINTERACHILTLEDPIEYVFEHRRSMITQREIGADVASFPAGLRAALREDPDVLLVGEMRDLESIQATLTIAETGHLVLATMHTNDTAQAIDRIIDVFPAERRPQIQLQLASTLLAVVFQRLLPTAERGQLVAAFEVMVATNAVRNLVREGRSRQLRNVIATGQADGMQTYEQALSALVSAGVVAHDVAAASSSHPKEVLQPGRTAG